jgi:hypothetical protein
MIGDVNVAVAEAIAVLAGDGATVALGAVATDAVDGAIDALDAQPDTTTRIAIPTAR